MATILIVDDVSANRKALVTLLHGQGHTLIEASNGGAGLALVKTETPDLVITDILMPVMDGYELVRQMRLEPLTSRIPVLFYTAPYSEREARALAKSSGVPYVLRKPAESDEVLTAVARVLSGDATALPPPTSPLRVEIDRHHLRLITSQLSENTADLKTANARLRALINIGLELSSTRVSAELLESVCAAARDLFGATYVTLGLLDEPEGTVQRVATCGVSAAGWVKTGDAIAGILRTVVAERVAVRGHHPGGDAASLQLPATHPGVQAFLAAPLASPGHVYGWICLVADDGRDFTEDDEQLVMALAGQVGRMYELEHEIVERKQVEVALRDERDRAQRYLDTAQVILIGLDAQGRITLINRKGCDLLGWTVRELLGRSWVDTCIPVVHRPAIRERFDQVIAGACPVAENEVLTRSGEERLIEWHNTVVQDDEGHVIGTLSSGKDMTASHQAIEAVRVAEERMRFALENAEIGIWDIDYASATLQWSSIIERQYGLQPGAFAGTFEAFIACVHPDDRDALLNTLAEATRSGADFSVQHRALWPDGTVHWLNGRGRIHLDDNGAPIRGVGISMDVTERHLLEEQYQQAQKMEAIGRLAGGVAHDFNNLLTLILGYCEILLADLDPADPRQADITEIHTAGTRAAGLTRQLLAFSRREIIQPTLLDLNVVMNDMWAMLGRLIGEDVKVVLALPPTLTLVKADRGQVEQIIANLALNARDAMPNGGTLTIETANVVLDEHHVNTYFNAPPGPYVMLAVTDTGTGMTPEVQARLFEPFFTTKPAGKGTGLGLATIHGIVARGGGSVDVYTEVGQGTSFKVYLPAAAATDAVMDAPAKPRPRPGTETVLVVEDSAGLRNLTQRLLQRQGYTVLAAASADEALRLVEAHPSIDVLLTDVVMPGGSGPELTARLATVRPTLKTIYMSGYTQDAIVHHGVLKPGIAFLHKPFTSEALGRKIRQVLDQPLAVPADVQRVLPVGTGTP